MSRRTDYRAGQQFGKWTLVGEQPLGGSPGAEVWAAQFARPLIDEQGREDPLTQSSFSSFLVKRDHALRKRAFHQFYEEFKDHQYTLATSLAYSVKADVFRARARKFPSIKNTYL